MFRYSLDVSVVECSIMYIIKLYIDHVLLISRIFGSDAMSSKHSFSDVVFHHSAVTSFHLLILSILNTC